MDHVYNVSNQDDCPATAESLLEQYVENAILDAEERGRLEKRQVTGG